jgi:hypothetical protein
VRLALLIYVIGVAVGLALTDAKPAARVALALAWPIGPLAFALVVTLLLVAALYIFPVFGAVVALGAAIGYWILR